MNNRIDYIKSNSAGTVTVILSSFLLFYLPSMLAVFSRVDEPMEWTLISVGMATVYTAVFCINYFWIVPLTLFRNDRKIAFFVLNLILVVLGCSLIPLWFETHGGLPHPEPRKVIMVTPSQYFMGYLRFVIRDGITMVLAAALAYALRLSQEREQMRRRELELNAERRQIELKSLKAQLNPHFLFNSLNNIYALIAISPERAQKSLHDLSNMLRFMIYDAALSTVPLDKEIKFIEDYVELMKLRLGSSVRLVCNLEKNNTENISVAPLIFLTIVENAFKHVSGKDQEKFIHISISIEKGSVTCRVVNSYNEEERRSSMSPSESGVGLANVERQLGLLYPGAYKMGNECVDGVYEAFVSISVSALRIQHKEKESVMNANNF